MSAGKLSLPEGAELAVAQHLQDLLLTREGRTLLVAAAESDDADETEELAVWLAEALTNGVDVDVDWQATTVFDDMPPPRRRR